MLSFTWEQMGKGTPMSKKLMARGPVNTSILMSRGQIPMSKNAIVKPMSKNVKVKPMSKNVIVKMQVNKYLLVYITETL